MFSARRLIRIGAAALLAGTAFAMAAPGAGASAAPGSAPPSGTSAQEEPVHRTVAHASASAQTLPPGFSVSGTDVSNYDGNINWSAVAANGVKFGWAKATEGTWFVDSYFNANYLGAKANGIVTGAYAFGRPDSGAGTGAAQADYLVDHAQYTVDGRTLPLELDMEWPQSGNACYGLSPSQMVGWIHDFVTEVQARTGRPAAIYTNPNWWNPCTGNSTAFSGNPLEDSQYVSGSNPLKPAGWSSFTAWQYAGSSSTLPGSPTVFNGTLGDLSAFVAPHVYALAPSGAGVWQYSGIGNGWIQIGGPAGVIYAGGSSLYATNPATGNIYRYNGTPGSWGQIGGPGYTFAMAGDTLYGLSPNRSAVVQFTGSGWIHIGGPAAMIYAGGDGLFATDPATGNVNHYNGTPGSWGQIGGPGAMFAVTDNGFFGLAPDRSKVMQWTGSGWTQVGGPAGTLYGTNMGLFAADPNTGNVNRYTGSGWVNVGGPGYTFAATDGNLFGLSPNQDTVFEWSGSGTAWSQIGGSADYLTAGS